GLARTISAEHRADFRPARLFGVPRLQPGISAEHGHDRCAVPTASEVWRRVVHDMQLARTDHRMSSTVLAEARRPLLAVLLARGIPETRRTVDEKRDGIRGGCHGRGLRPK